MNMSSLVLKFKVLMDPDFSCGLLVSTYKIQKLPYSNFQFLVFQGCVNSKPNVAMSEKSIPNFERQ